MNPPVVSETDLQTLAPGLYRLGKQELRTLYNVSDDAWVTGLVDQIVRIREDTGRLPQGVELAEIRADGRQLIISWQLIEIECDSAS